MAMAASLTWDNKAAWDNKVLLATNLAYRSHLLVMCAFYSLYVGKLHRHRCCLPASLDKLACSLQI